MNQLLPKYITASCFFCCLFCQQLPFIIKNLIPGTSATRRFLRKVLQQVSTSGKWYIYFQLLSSCEGNNYWEWQKLFSENLLKGNHEEHITGKIILFTFSARKTDVQGKELSLKICIPSLLPNWCPCERTL